MASANAKECVCCADHRSQHGLKLVFTACTSALCPPAVDVSSLELNKFFPVIFSSYFCRFAIGQRKDEFFTRGTRTVRYYIHCHCQSPGSLQCRSASVWLMKQCENMELALINSECLPAPTVCCDSWLCCPLKSLGMVLSRDKHYFVFQAADISSVSISAWKVKYSTVNVRVHENLFFVFVFCECHDSVENCLRRCAAVFNSLRVMMSCHYDRFQFTLDSARVSTLEDPVDITSVQTSS